MRLYEKCIVIFAALSIFSVVGCGGDSNDSELGGAPIVPGPGGWFILSQHGKNVRILEAAISDLDDDVQLSCKNWIHRVVKLASDGDASVPQNNESGDGWQEDSDGRVFGSGAAFNTPADILGADPGAIVQMQWKEGFGSSNPAYNMHTAIVLYVFSSYILFIESNYDDTPEVADGPTYVRIRWQSAEDFEKKVESFTIYYVR